MQLDIDLKIEEKDQIDLSISSELSEMYGAQSKEVKDLLSKVKKFVLNYNDNYFLENANEKIMPLREKLFSEINDDLWENSYVVIELFTWLAPTESMYLFPIKAWSNLIFQQQLENNENFFKLVWSDGLEFFMDDRKFDKNICESQKNFYGLNFDEVMMTKVKDSLRIKLNELLRDLDWVIPQVRDNPRLYPYISKDLKINDNVLALTFSVVNESTDKSFFDDLIPYEDIAKDPFVMAAFLTFFYYKVKNNEIYFINALKALKSETQIQAIIDNMNDGDVLKEIFLNKYFLQNFKDNSTILLQGLKKNKDIYKILPEYMRGSKAVVEIMIYEHNSEFLEPKALDYWREDISKPKLFGPVYEYLKNRVEDLSILKFVHWRRNYEFISSLEKNPFEYNVPFSKDDFELITSNNFSTAKRLIEKFPDFYEVANVDIKCNLECIMEYLKNGLGLFEERFEKINSNLFYNDELIFECINNDIGEVLLKISDKKWNDKQFILKYFKLLDNLKEMEEENAFVCLYTYLPQRLRNFLELNAVHSNYYRFFKKDQEVKEKEKKTQK